MKKLSILILIFLTLWITPVSAAVFNVDNNSQSGVCTITFDGSTDFNGATNANTLWTKGVILYSVVWTVPALNGTVTFRNISATGTKLFPTITMDTLTSAIKQFKGLFCFPYVKGSEMPDGAVATLEYSKVTRTGESVSTVP